ncbi:8903_t:CDS:2, partial [Entrophospora sp. SA101]
DPNQYLVKTGAFIDDVKLCKKAWIFPNQRSMFFDITPANYTLQLQAMTAEKLEFNLPAVFTIGPKDEKSSLERYAKLLAAHDKSSDHVKDLVRGIIEGETRVIAAAMTMEEIFRERKGFKEEVIKSVQAELDQFGLFIYNANVKQLQDTQGSEYFAYMRMKTHEGAVNQAKVDVAEAKYKGDVGAKDREGSTRRETSKIEAETVLVEKERQVAIAQAEMNLNTKKAEYNKQTKIAEIEAAQAAKKREAELQKEVEERRLLSETERLRVQYVSKAKAEFEANKANSDAKLYTAQKEAEAELYKKQKEAEGVLALYNSQAEGVKNLMQAFDGDTQSAIQYIMIQRDTFQQLAKENALAVQGLNPKITVWNTGGESSAQSFNNPISNIFQSLPPLLSTIQDQTGIKPPNWIAQAQIVIDPKGMIIRMLYYRPQAYYKTLEKVANACRESVFNFQYTDICEWPSNQALYQIYPPISGYIPRPSYNNAKKPNLLHFDDLFYMPWGKIKGMLLRMCTQTQISLCVALGFSSGPGRRILGFIERFNGTSAKRPFRGQHSNELAIGNVSEARVKDNTSILITMSKKLHYRICNRNFWNKENREVQDLIN